MESRSAASPMNSGDLTGLLANRLNSRRAVLAGLFFYRGLSVATRVTGGCSDMKPDRRELPWRVYAEDYLALLGFARAAATHAGEGTRLDPGDILHEAIRRQVVANRTFKDREHCIAALRTVMRSVCANEARRRRFVGGDDVARVAGPDPFPESAVAEALAWLRDRDARLAQLVEQCLRTGERPSEAAGDMGVAASTARHWWAQALAELRKHFSDH